MTCMMMAHVLKTPHYYFNMDRVMIEQEVKRKPR